MEEDDFIKKTISSEIQKEYKDVYACLIRMNEHLVQIYLKLENQEKKRNRKSKEYAKRSKITLTDEKENKILNEPIENLNLSEDLLSLLKLRNCFFVKEILRFTKEDLIYRAGLNKKLLKEFERFLKINSIIHLSNF